ncbi:hypothetical protein SAY86_023961 [Trapa natans]|uniref:Uncharacterized protein n=1 Tax=Trapa natans TaxID=22666 RepID=A0AAN7LVC2_TRANT|nr:hypothetical protein SAY86_023961 [Trapa natans]
MRRSGSEPISGFGREKLGTSSFQWLLAHLLLVDEYISNSHMHLLPKDKPPSMPIWCNVIADYTVILRRGRVCFAYRGSLLLGSIWHSITGYAICWEGGQVYKFCFDVIGKMT